MLLYAAQPSDKYIPILGSSVSYKFFWHFQIDTTKIEPT